MIGSGLCGDGTGCGGLDGGGLGGGGLEVGLGCGLRCLGQGYTVRARVRVRVRVGIWAAVQCFACAPKRISELVAVVDA